MFDQTQPLIPEEENTTSPTMLTANNQETKVADKQIESANEIKANRVADRANIDTTGASTSSGIDNGQRHMSAKTEDNEISVRQKYKRNRPRRKNNSTDNSQTIFTISENLESNLKNSQNVKNSRQPIGGVKRSSITNGWSATSPPGPVDSP